MRVKSALIVLLCGALLSACSLGKKPDPTAVPSNTPLPLPTVKPTDSSPLAILVMPADLDKATSDSYQTTVYKLTQASGMRFQVRNGLSPKELDPGLKVVVALPPDPGIAALSAAAPGAQFLAIDIPGITAGGNVSTLATNSQQDVPAFIAGYTAAMLSDDHRIGMMLPAGDATAQAAKQAFANGMAYYCGLCQPFLYLPYGYPQFQEIPADAPTEQYSGYANVFISSYKIEAVYLYGSASVKEITDALVNAGISVIGTTPPDPRPATWAMTIRPDELKAIEKAWPDLVAGKGGQSVQSPLGLADLDSGVVTPGKQRLVQQVLNDLQAGRISTGVAP